MSSTDQLQTPMLCDSKTTFMRMNSHYRCRVLIAISWFTHLRLDSPSCCRLARALLTKGYLQAYPDACPNTSREVGVAGQNQPLTVEETRRMYEEMITETRMDARNKHSAHEDAYEHGRALASAFICALVRSEARALPDMDRKPSSPVHDFIIFV